MMTALEAARDELATISGVLTCKVGMNPDLSPDDFPLIRLVPERITPGKPYGKREAETLIYFGVPLTSDTLEAGYEALFALEAEIIGKLPAVSGRYVETITDRDELGMPYKMMAIRCVISG